MIPARLDFGSPKGKIRSLYGPKDELEGILVGLQKMGHLWGNYVIYSKNKHFYADVILARSDALDKKILKKHDQPLYQDILNLFKNFPKVTLLDDLLPKRFPNWKSADFLYLLTGHFDKSSPVCRGKTGEAIATYTLPLDDCILERLFFWMEWYKNLDSIWLSSHEPLEMAAYEELASPTSHLAKEGRELCKLIEEATKKPTYYFLKHYYKDRNEQRELCPSCLKPWKRLDEDPIASGLFAFQCEDCRLVSEHAKEVF